MEKGLRIEFERMCKDPDYFGKIGTPEFNSEALRMIAIGIHALGIAICELNTTLEEINELCN